jgi:hypothetical protein
VGGREQIETQHEDEKMNGGSDQGGGNKPEADGAYLTADLCN